MVDDTQKEAVLLAELVAARLCHDLAGPIGAFNNGVELLEEDDGDMAGQAVELLAMSAKEARAKVQLFRIAYGVINHEGSANPEELRQTLDHYFSQSKVTLEWQLQEGLTFFTTAARRLLANMVLIVSSALLGGGTLKVSLAAKGNGLYLEAHGESPRLKHDTELLAIVRQGLAAETLPSARTVPACLLHCFSRAAAVEPVVEAEESFLKIKLFLPAA